MVGIINHLMVKFAILMNQDSYIGRQYLDTISKFIKSINITIIEFNKKNSNNKIEDIRCGGLWKPPEVNIFYKKYKNYKFKNINSNEFNDFLLKNHFDYGIQAGCGIISKKIIKLFKFGILNFHPGDLPLYRGASAPEWQIIENNPVIATCHFLDKDIDSGPIYKKKDLGLNNYNYEKMRSMIYPKLSLFLKDIVQEILNGVFDETIIDKNKYNNSVRKYIGDDKINLLKHKLKNFNR